MAADMLGPGPGTEDTDSQAEFHRPLPAGFPDVLSDENAQRLLDLVFGTGETAELVAKLKTLTDMELAGLVVDHVWAFLPPSSPMYPLLDEVIERLTKGQPFPEE